MNNTSRIPSLTRPDAGVLAHGGISFVFPGVPRALCVFSTVLSGNMAITDAMSDDERAEAAANRRKLLELVELNDWVELKQVHEDHMAVNPEPTPVGLASDLEADGACTSRSRLALAIKTADCQPIFMTNLEGTAVAALHVGWRGNALGFPAKGLHRFCEEYGILAKDVLAVRGPSLGPSAAEFVHFSKDWPPEFLPWFHGESDTMDLWALTRHQLVHAGMRPEHIFSLDLCTHSLPDLFFSHRRGHAGRQASMIWLK